MLKFNNNHIFTGYIKQLLASFNLPKYRVYTVENAREAAGLEPGALEPHIIPTIPANLVYEQDNLTVDTNIHTMYVPYIKDDIIQEYIVDRAEYVDRKVIIQKAHWENRGIKTWGTKDYLPGPHVHHYEYNMAIPNYTKKLEIKNNIYDSYTHEYLGDYLRFNRDYLNIDLMPLYNCFSNRLCNILHINFIDSISGRTVSFNSNDSKYKIYMLPVKLMKEYTIAIDSEAPIEFCCGIYGKYQDKRSKFNDLPKLTYWREGVTHFNKPILYTKLTELFEHAGLEAEIAQNEVDLKLFIKLPYTNTSSITILEGDYRNWNDKFLTFKRADGSLSQNATFDRQYNRSIINFEDIQEDTIIKPITQLQLLQLNTGTSYPFADRLIEYLSDNVITNEDTISDNILRAQTVMSTDGFAKEDRFPYNFNPVTFKYPGAWSTKIRALAYSYMTNPENKLALAYNVNHDLLGYIDKDTEKLFTRSADSDGTLISISNVDIYPEIYKDSKVK